jgi:hypothetical protein
MKLSQSVWSEVESKVCEALRCAGLQSGGVRRCFGSHPDSYDHLEVVVPLRDRFLVVRAITAGLGPSFVANYYKHPDAIPQDVVYVFPADHAWSDLTFDRSNVSKTRAPKPRASAELRDHKGPSFCLDDIVES